MDGLWEINWKPGLKVDTEVTSEGKWTPSQELPGVFLVEKLLLVSLLVIGARE